MGKRRLFFSALVTLLCLPSLLLAEIDFFGFYQNRFFLFSRTGAESQRLNKLEVGDYNRLRLHLSSSVTKSLSVNLAVDFFSFHGEIQNPLGVYEFPGHKNDILMRLDRAHIDFYLPHFDIILGKQRLSFGVSRFWTPLDIFNRVNIFDPSEAKPGVNALKMVIPVGGPSNLTAVFAPDSKFSASRAGVRFQSMIKEIDIGFNFFHLGEKRQNIYGIDLRGENYVGWWMEAGYFTSSAGNKTKLVMGLDYTFPFLGGIYWQNEFFFDESGGQVPLLYEWEKLRCGDRFTLGRTYFLSKLRTSIAKFLAGSITYVGNWVDETSLLNPDIQFPVTQNITINTGFFLSFGSPEGEFKKLKDSNNFYIWLKAVF
jgi:hypothetical protein